MALFRLEKSRTICAASALLLGLSFASTGCKSKEAPCEHGAKRQFDCGDEDTPGMQPQSCIEGVWYSTSFCGQADGTRHPSDTWGTAEHCVDGATRAAVCGEENRGLEPQACRAGVWTATNACSFGAKNGAEPTGLAADTSAGAETPSPDSTGEAHGAADPTPSLAAGEAAAGQGADRTNCIVLKEGMINGGKTLEANTCYSLDSTLTVRDGTLSIPAGVVVQAAKDTWLVITESGRIQAEGTEAQPIRFQGKAEEKGFWAGLRIDGTGSGENTFAHVLIQHAGSEAHYSYPGRRGGIVLMNEANVRIENVRFVQNRGPGVSIDHYNGRAYIKASHFDGNEKPLRFHARQLVDLADDLVFTNNQDSEGQAQDFVEVWGDESSDRPGSWPAYTYRFTENASIGAKIAIQPGAVLLFDGDKGLRVTEDRGVLIAKGSEAQPIVFSSPIHERGSWRGIYMDGTRSTENLLQHVRIEYAGQAGHSHYDSLRGGLTVTGEETHVKVLNSHFVDNDYAGLSVSSGKGRIQLDGLSFERNASPLRIAPRHVGTLGETLHCKENDLNEILVEDRDGLSVEQEATWRNYGVPYQVRGLVVIEAAVTLNPGLRLRFNQDSGILVQANGSVHAVGKEDARIVFEGVEPLPSTWYGLRILSRKGANQLAYVDLLHAGAAGWHGAGYWQASLSVEAQGTLKVEETRIAESETNGIYTDDTGNLMGCTSLVFENISGDEFHGRITSASDCK